MIDTAASAQALYGETAPEPAADTLIDASKPAERSAADVLYPEPTAAPEAQNIPENIRQLREADRGGLYDNTPAPDLVRDLEEATAAVVVEGISNEQRQAAVREMAQMFRDVSAERDDQQAIINVFRETAATPPDEATIHAWRNEAEKRLAEIYADSAPRVLELARRLVARDPRVERMLAHNGRGNHPDVVLRVVRMAVRERQRGRLK